MLQILLFAVFCMFAAVIAFGTFAVLYHFQRFRTHENSHRIRTTVFLIGSAVFVWLEVSFAGTISWQDIADLVTHNFTR